MLGINAGRDKELKVGRFRHLSSNRCEEDCAWVCRDIFLWIIILCKEFSGIDIFKLEYLTKSLNPKKWWQRISEDQHMKKVERFIVCCSSHCTFTSFVNCLSSCFYFYANRRNLFQNSAHMRRAEIESQKGEVSILVVCFFFFFQLLRICSRLWR